MLSGFFCGLCFRKKIAIRPNGYKVDASPCNTFIFIKLFSNPHWMTLLFEPEQLPEVSFFLLWVY